MTSQNLRLVSITSIALLLGCNNAKEAKSSAAQGPVATTTAKASAPKIEPGVPAPSANLFEISDAGWGAINEHTNFEALQAAYGASNVVDDKICEGECTTYVEITRVYPDTNKALTIYWKEGQHHKAVSMVECNAESAPYRTASGLGIGTTLEELLAKNGQKISFYGFDWDLGGKVASFNKGTLAKSRLGIQLALAGQVKDKALTGDSELTTDLPAVSRNLKNIKVSTLTLSF